MEFNQKQLQILETAERLFAMQGFHGTSVRDIAQEADVNVAMISYYFGSKERLIESIFLKRIYDVRVTVDELVKNEDLSPLEKINKLIDIFVGRISQRPYFCRIMVRAQVTQESIATDLIHENKLRMYELVGQLIREGQQKGVFVKDVDVLMVVNTLVGTTNHAIISKDFQKKLWQQQDMPEEEFRLLLQEKVSNYLRKLFKVLLTYEA